MKFVRFPILFFVFLAAAVLMTACAEDEGVQGTAQTQQEQQKPEIATAPPAQSGEQGGTTAGQQAETGTTSQQPGGQAGGQQQVEIAGKVEQTADGFVIRSVNESYMATGKDLADMVGKDVKVTGTLQQDQGQQTIVIASISEIK